MIAKYSDNTGLSIEASTDEFIFLAKNIVENSAFISCELDEIDPFPYQKLLSRIMIKIEPGKLANLQVIENMNLLISGSKENLIQLASEIDTFAKNKQLGNHLHIEYYDEHFYLASDAVPLVIERL